MKKAQILIVDDHPFFIHGLGQFLEATGKYKLLSALSVGEALEIFAASRPDLVIMDVSMAEGGGMALLQALKSKPDVRLMFLTVQIDPEDTIAAMRMGVHGIALKDRDPEEILETIETVLAGGTRFDGAVTEGALRYSVTNPTPQTKQDALLTARESSIVDHVLQGMRNREIADEMKLSEGTVKVHMHNIFRKLGVTSRTELIVKRGNIRKAS